MCSNRSARPTASEPAAVTPEQMQDGILNGNPAVQRRAMAKAITLLESTRADHRAAADVLLTALLPHTGGSFRLGISGVPGVMRGKGPRDRKSTRLNSSHT